MKKLLFISIILFVFIGTKSLQAQKKNCTFIDGVMKNELVMKAYNVIKDVDMEKRLYCTEDGKYLIGFKKNTNGDEELQIGFYYTVESVENRTVPLRKDFASKCKKIYNQIKGKEKIKPQVSFRLYFISNTGTYAMGKITYDKKGKPFPYTNEKHRNTAYGGFNIFPGVNGTNYGYTSDIIY